MYRNWQKARYTYKQRKMLIVRQNWTDREIDRSGKADR
jgi:hypothetical protein